MAKKVKKVKKSDKFGYMLTEGIYAIKGCEDNKKISIIEDELGYALGYKGGSAVERWRQGYLPPTVTKIEKLTGLIFERTSGALDRAWFEQFLQSAAHSYPKAILDEFFSKRHRPSPFLAPPLPEQALIGRDQLLLDLKQRLFRGDTQSLALFALNGLPGVGKTALALTLAHDKEVWQRFPDGILWAGLGREPNMMALLSIWGVALEIPMGEMAKLKTPFERAWLIRAAIGERKMLLVIDDAWQIDHALAFKFGGPNCAHLLTTRQPDLALDFARREAVAVQELNQSDSFALLSHFVPDLVIKQPDEAGALVQAVGGLPLALILLGRYIEKVVPLGQKEVLSRLLTQLQQASARFELILPQSVLKNPYGVPLSLLASIEISDKALDDAARQMLRALSLFQPKPNSFSEEAALNVADKPAETLKMLTDSGLLESGRTELEQRYTMHQTIADYANLRRFPDSLPFGYEKKNGTEPCAEERSKEIAEIAYQRGASYFAAFAQQHRHSDGYRLLDADWQNVGHFLQWAYEHRHWQPVTNGAEALTYINLGVVGFMDARGHWSKVTDLLHQALEGARALNDRQLEAAILTKLGAFAFRQSNFDTARQHLEQSLPYLSDLPPSTESTLLRTHLYEFMSRVEMGHDLEAARDWIEQGLTELDTSPAESEVITHQTGYFHILLSTLHGRMGRFPEAITAGEKGLALLPPEPTAARVSALTTLGTVFSLQGEIGKSIEYQKKGVEIAQELGDWRRAADLWMNLGNNGLRSSNFSPAIANYQKALQLYQQMGDVNAECRVHTNLGLIYILLGEDELALSYLTTAIHSAETHGLLRREAFAKTNLGHFLIYQEQLAEAASALSRAHEICRPLNLTSLLPIILYWQAEIARLKGEDDKAMGLIEQSLQVAKNGGRLLAEGIGWSIKGKILDRMQRFDEAKAAHQTSLQILAEQNPYELARSKLALAEHYVMRDTQRARCGYVSERAKSLLAEALATFERLGTKREIALIEAMR